MAPTSKTVVMIGCERLRSLCDHSPHRCRAKGGCRNKRQIEHRHHPRILHQQTRCTRCSQITTTSTCLKKQRILKRHRSLFINLNDDTEKLVYIINIKKTLRYPQLCSNARQREPESHVPKCRCYLCHLEKRDLVEASRQLHLRTGCCALQRRDHCIRPRTGRIRYETVLCRERQSFERHVL